MFVVAIFFRKRGPKIYLMWIHPTQLWSHLIVEICLMKTVAYRCAL